MSKINKILADLNILKLGQNNILTNLTKIQPKEPKQTIPTTMVPQKFAVEQIDTLYLPEDNGYKYLLVLVDLATSLCDAEPLKTKTPEETKKALEMNPRLFCISL